MKKEKIQKKYELTDEVVIEDGLKLHRIRALRSFGDVKAGDLGGFIQCEENLHHEGNAWVSGDAGVFGHAKVSGNARVFGNTVVLGNAKVSENAQVFGNSIVSGNACISGNAWVFDNAWVRLNAKVSGNAWIYGDSEVCGNAVVSGDAWVYQNAVISDNAKVSGNVQVSGNAFICENALISLKNHFMTIGPIGSLYDFATFFRTEENKIGVSCGCIHCFLDEFLNEVKKTDIDNEYIHEYEIITEFARRLIKVTLPKQ